MRLQGHRHPLPRLTAFLALAALLALGAAALRSFGAGSGIQTPSAVPPIAPAVMPPAVAPAAPAIGNASAARRLAYKVVGSYPHDRAAFLQGLLWHNGGFYESTGLEGESSVRRVEFPSGRVLRKTALSPELFGEGLALVGDRLVQLTWQSRLGLVYDRDTLRPLRRFSYNTEGWGLTYDGKNLIMSDGSDTLTYLDPTTYQPGRRLRVTLDGEPLRDLNELEWIKGEIWANVWQTDLIVRIAPATGRVTSYLDLSGMLKPALRHGEEDVLNGIAYDAQKDRIFVSGKLWPRLFEIKVQD